MPIKLYHNSHVNDGMSRTYYDNIEYISNASNAVKMAWADVQSASKKPADTATFNDVPFPESVDHGVFTELAATTYNILESMMKGGKPKAMDLWGA
ncbi:hypothetical protein CTA2_1450 [Colletotrichum tanaceti]|uniref:Uncharacterized protein n=1 Tax=Colletotrichum tanaceti TaxID=1306861 RepID=A0A4U6XCJ4_9PEZI|nr:hypothetical protein CTA2_1450 [Colletotrichum tanaceti]TKW51507.1 hypothetical protein CTA1_7253 [Colletotrichum tanaceti]